MRAQFSAGWGGYRSIAMAESISQAHRSFQLKILIAIFLPRFFVYLPYSRILSFPLLVIPDCGISFVFSVQLRN
ncbi:hypothetical protein PRIPAC_77649, partial [Pristionchus pacificus]|uniref:Uncharacterized protein n=1 Tax=Pristionchus pacificus TaxID=54126 RepID=A0A2A6CKN4_PRIPA